VKWNKVNFLYQLEVDCPNAANLCHEVNITEVVKTTKLWRYWLGQVLEFLGTTIHDSNNRVTSVPKLPPLSETCLGCLLGWQQCKKIPRESESQASRVLNLIHMDLCGPLPIESLSDLRYFMVLMDDYVKFKFMEALGQS
jgi:hypothetical protein